FPLVGVKVRNFCVLLLSPHSIEIDLMSLFMFLRAELQPHLGVDECVVHPELRRKLLHLLLSRIGVAVTDRPFVAVNEQEKNATLNTAIKLLEKLNAGSAGLIVRAVRSVRFFLPFGDQ